MTGNQPAGGIVVRDRSEAVVWATSSPDVVAWIVHHKHGPDEPQVYRLNLSADCARTDTIKASKSMTAALLKLVPDDYLCGILDLVSDPREYETPAPRAFRGPQGFRVVLIASMVLVFWPPLGGEQFCAGIDFNTGRNHSGFGTSVDHLSNDELIDYLITSVLEDWKGQP